MEIMQARSLHKSVIYQTHFKLIFTSINRVVYFIKTNRASLLLVLQFRNTNEILMIVWKQEFWYQKVPAQISL